MRDLMTPDVNALRQLLRDVGVEVIRGDLRSRDVIEVARAKGVARAAAHHRAGVRQPRHARVDAVSGVPVPVTG